MEPINDVMELFRHQRAVRAWSDRPVSDEVVRQVKSMADPDLTNPSIVFVAHSKGRVDNG